MKVRTYCANSSTLVTVGNQVPSPFRGFSWVDQTVYPTEKDDKETVFCSNSPIFTSTKGYVFFSLERPTIIDMCLSMVVSAWIFLLWLAHVRYLGHPGLLILCQARLSLLSYRTIGIKASSVTFWLVMKFWNWGGCCLLPRCINNKSLKCKTSCNCKGFRTFCFGADTTVVRVANAVLDSDAVPMGFNSHF